MAFQPRQFPEIFDDMVNFVRASTRITDFSVGSVIRTILEAAALEDDEQYFQMVQLLDAFSIRTSTGADLDARVAEYNVVRLQPSSSVGSVVIRDGNLITDLAAFDASATDTTITLDDSTRFPTSGYPYTVRVGEGTVAVEDVSVSNNNTSTGVLTISALVNDHSIGAMVSIVSGSDKIISSGLQVQVPAVGDSSAIVFVTIEGGTIVAGDYESTPISARALIPGAQGIVGSGRISQFTTSAPFNGALVTNLSGFTGGRNIESDSDLRDRALAVLQSISKGTPLALKESVIGITDPVSGQRISTSSILEKFTEDEVIVYVDDGSGFIPDQVTLARDFVGATVPAAPPQSTLTLNDASEFSEEGWVLVSPESAQIHLVEYTAVDYGTNTLTLASSIEDHDIADEVALVEVITPSSEAGVDFYSLLKWPIVRSSQRLWVGPDATNMALQVEGVDYYLNKARGRIEFITSVPTGSIIAISYSHYTGLIFYAQRVINGSDNDPINFPGVVAAGIEAIVETPVIRRVTVRLSITADEGFDEDTLAPLIQVVIESYISALGIGEDVIVSEIIERSMGVTGVYNVYMQEPLTDISVGKDELPVPFSATGASLIMVN